MYHHAFWREFNTGQAEYSKLASGALKAGQWSTQGWPVEHSKLASGALKAGQMCDTYIFVVTSPLCLASFPGLHAQLLLLAVRKVGEGLDGFIM